MTEPAEALSRALSCSAGLDHATATPVLLVHGTFADAGYWDGNYRDALPRDGHPVCAVTTPGRQFVDINRSVQYVVAAIRTMAARAGRPIAVVGHSQGASVATFALRFWPDLGTDVSDFIGLGGVYENGDETAALACKATCPPAGFQISPGSNFLAAYAAQPLVRGADYTSIATSYDVFSTPQPTASLLRGARNITLQDVCPGHVIDHLTLALDGPAYALALDAINHPGPADPSRVGSSACAHQFLPGADPTPLLKEVAGVTPDLSGFAAGYDQGEPPVPCATNPNCPKPKLKPRLTLHRKGSIISGELILPPGATDQCSGTVAVRGGRTTRRAALPPTCGYRTRLGASAQAALVVRYLGSSRLYGAERRRPATRLFIRVAERDASQAPASRR